MAIASAFVAAALLISVWGGDWYLAIPSGLVLPLYLAGFMRGERFASRAAIGSVLTLSLAAVTAYPIYLGLLILGFVATRLFYFWRFAMTYPNFGFGGEGGQYHVYRKSS
ncbi:MAG: hypothetical protein IID05_13720 [Gemmatimonadetes bacterium]|nr:hypothetical protein [Gemmatimonadota bacterium]